jgi:hypothetical protein
MDMRIIAIGLLALALVGCSKPEDTVIPSEVASWDTQLAPAVKKLSEEDQALLAAYLMRAKMGEAFGGEGMPPGLTIGQAVEAEKKLRAEEAKRKAEEEALKRKLEAERAAAVKAIQEAVTVTLLKKRRLESDWQSGRISDQLRFSLGFENKTDKPIVGVSGSMKFVDIFDKEVAESGFKMTDTIPPHGTITWNGVKDHNQFMDSDRALWNLEEGKYTATFVPEMIVFEDGTKLTVPK